MTRPRRTHIVVRKRTVMVERKAVARPSKWQAQKPVVAWRAGQADQRPTELQADNPPSLATDLPPDRPILAEVQRCLSHGPIAFPQKLWGEVL